MVRVPQLPHRSTCPPHSHVVGAGMPLALRVGSDELELISKAHTSDYSDWFRMGAWPPWGQRDLRKYLLKFFIMSCNFTDALLASDPGSLPFFPCPDLSVLLNVPLQCFLKIDINADFIQIKVCFLYSCSKPGLANWCFALFLVFVFWFFF